MEPMTPEERFTRIENLLNAMTEHHAQFDEKLEAQRLQHEADHAQHTKEIAELREMQKAIAAGMIRLQEAHERSNRRFEEEMKAVDERLRATAEAQRITEEKLHALIDTVDRIIRQQNL